MLNNKVESDSKRRCLVESSDSEVDLDELIDELDIKFEKPVLRPHEEQSSVARSSDTPVLPPGSAVECLYSDQIREYYKCVVKSESDGIYTIEWTDKDPLYTTGHPIEHFRGYEVYSKPEVSIGLSASEWSAG